MEGNAQQIEKMATEYHSPIEHASEANDEAPAMLATMPGNMNWSPATTNEGVSRSVGGTPEVVFVHPQHANAIAEYNRNKAEQEIALQQVNDLANRLKDRKGSMSTSVSSTKRGARSTGTSEAGVRRAPALRDTASSMNQELGKVMETEPPKIEIIPIGDGGDAKPNSSVSPDTGSGTSSMRGRSRRPPSASLQTNEAATNEQAAWGSLPPRAPASYGPRPSIARARSAEARKLLTTQTRPATSPPTAGATFSPDAAGGVSNDHVMAIEDAGATDGIITEYRAQAEGLKQQILAINFNMAMLTDGGDKEKAASEVNSLRAQLAALIEKSRADELRLKGTEAIAEQQRAELAKAQGTINQGIHYVGGMRQFLAEGDEMWRNEKLRVTELESEMHQAMAVNSELRKERHEANQGFDKLCAEANAEITNRDAKIQNECRAAQRAEAKASAERHERQLSEERGKRKDEEIINIKKKMHGERAALMTEGQRIMHELTDSKNESAQLTATLGHVRSESEDRKRTFEMERAQAMEREASNEAQINKLKAAIDAINERGAHKDLEYARAITGKESLSDERTAIAEAAAIKAREEASEARMELKRIHREVEIAERRAQLVMIEKEQEKKDINENCELKLKEMEERMMSKMIEMQKSRSRTSSQSSSRSSGSAALMKKQIEDMNREFILKQQKGEELLRKIQATAVYAPPSAPCYSVNVGVTAEKTNDNEPKSGETTQTYALSPNSFDSLPNDGAPVLPTTRPATAVAGAQLWPGMKPAVPSSWTIPRRNTAADANQMGTIAEHMSPPSYNAPGHLVNLTTGAVVSSPPITSVRTSEGAMLTAWGNQGGDHEGGGPNRDGGGNDGNSSGNGGPGQPGGGPSAPNPGGPPYGQGPPNGPPGPPDGNGPPHGYYPIPMMPYPYSRHQREAEKVTISDLPKDLRSFSTWWQTTLYNLSSQTALSGAEESHRWISCALGGTATEEQLKNSDYGLAPHLCGQAKMDNFDQKLASAIMTKVDSNPQLGAIITRMRMDAADGRPITGRSMLRAIVNIWTTDPGKQSQYILQKLARLSLYDSKSGETDWPKFMDQWWHILGCTRIPPEDEALCGILEARMRECKTMMAPMMEYDLQPLSQQTYPHLLRRMNIYLQSRRLVQIERGFMQSDIPKPKREDAPTTRTKTESGPAVPAAAPIPPTLPDDKPTPKIYGVCWGYERYGNCTRPNCQFSHEGKPGTATRPPPGTGKGAGKGKGMGKGDRPNLPKDKACNHFLVGMCRFGATCRDVHVKAECFEAYTRSNLTCRRGEGTDEEKTAKINANIEQYDQRRVAVPTAGGIASPAVPAAVVVDYDGDQDDDYLEWYGGVSNGMVLCALRDDDDGFWEEEVAQAGEEEIAQVEDMTNQSSNG